MSATKISDYSIGGSNWTELLTTIEKQRKGFNGISLTNYDNNSLPAIAEGSYFEISGSLYGFESEEAITGTPSSGNINYIYINGTTFVPVWTTTAPTWSDAKNGWYDAGETHRYVGGCYYDGANYTGKWVYQKGSDRIDSDCKFGGRVTRYYAPSLVGYGNNDTVTFNGQVVAMAANDDEGFLSVNLPHGAIVINLYSYAFANTWGSLPVQLVRSPVDEFAQTIMATNTHTSTGALNDNSITDATIDNENYTYFIRFSWNLDTIGQLRGVVITYTITEPKP